MGTVDERGIFSVGGDRFVRDFTVELVGEEWRIADPEDGLVILEPDFERVYDQLNAYFIDPTGKRVVPDPRYLVVGEAQPTALVQRLFEGPSPALRAGVDNPLQGLALRRPVTVDGSTATVDLTGLPAEPDPPLRQISAQLVWTLLQSRIRSVEVLVEGEAVSLAQVPRAQTTDDWAAYDPDAVPVDAVGHYVDDTGALRTAPDGEQAPGPAGEGAYDLVSAAASSNPTSGELAFLAAVTAPDRAGDQRLLAGPYGGELAAVLRRSGSLTAPTVAGTRPEIWTVRNGTDVVRVLPGATPQEVSASALAGIGHGRRAAALPGRRSCRADHRHSVRPCAVPRHGGAGRRGRGRAGRPCARSTRRSRTPSTSPGGPATRSCCSRTTPPATPSSPTRSASTAGGSPRCRRPVCPPTRRRSPPRPTRSRW